MYLEVKTLNDVFLICSLNNSFIGVYGINVNILFSVCIAHYELPQALTDLLLMHTVHMVLKYMWY